MRGRVIDKEEWNGMERRREGCVIIIIVNIYTQLCVSSSPLLSSPLLSSPLSYLLF
jgi:hypothetical protein